jgi:hypothetical protein
MKSSAEKDPPRKKSAERLGELRSRYMEIAVKLPISPDLGVQRSILPLTSSKRFAALPVWLEFAIALSAFSVSVFSISALPSLPFPRPPIFATSFAKASSYAKASADKTAVRKASTGRPVRPNGSSWAYRRKQIPRSKVRRHRCRVWIVTKMFHFSLIFLLANLGGGGVA